MKCLICNKPIILKKNIQTLFKDEHYLVCSKCYQLYPLKIGLVNIPINNSDISIYYLFEREYFIKYDAFITELSFVFFHLYTKYKDKYIFIYNVIELNEKMLSSMEKISSLFDNKVVYLCYFIKN